MQAAHSAYLNNANNRLPPADTYNHTGRGYPDVAAVAWDVALVVNGQDGLVGGTSCAAPAIGGILSLLNDIRISQKKSVLGYVNPLFYESSTFPNGFVNIVSGPTNSASGCQGFHPAAGGGWSPITGFGGISYAGMSSIVSNLK
jgi:tripeptidyl-peptidase-1